MNTVDAGHIVVEPGVMSGEPHIAGHRIAVADVAIWTTHHGMSPSEIAAEFGLTLGEVHAALAYYYDHQDAMDRAIAASDRQHDAMAKRYPTGWRPGAVAADADSADN